MCFVWEKEGREGFVGERNLGKKIRNLSYFFAREFFIFYFLENHKLMFMNNIFLILRRTIYIEFGNFNVRIYKEKKFIALMPSKLLITHLEVFHHIKHLHVFILLLKLRVHHNQHETTNF